MCTSPRPTSPRSPFAITLALLALLASVAASGEASAQVLQSGRRFVVAFPDTLGNLPARSSGSGSESAFDNVMWIVVIASIETRVSVGNDSLRIDTVAGAGRSTVIRLDRQQRRFAAQNITVARDAYTVTADQPVGLLCYYVTQYGSEAFTPLPVEMWGTEYTVPGVPSETVYDDMTFAIGEEGTMRPVYAPGEFVVVAAEDETIVTIDAAANMGDWYGFRTKVKVTLDAGDSYVVKPGAPPAPIPPRGTPPLPFGVSDLARSTVTSTKPVGVIAGNTRTQGNKSLPWTVFTGNSIRNAAAEWLTPRSMNGTTYVYATPWSAGIWVADDLVRVYGTARDRNYVQSSMPLPNQVAFNQFLQMHLGAVPGNDGSFWIRSTLPSQVTVNGAPFVEPDAAYPGEGIRSLAAASVDLVPRERWGDYSRFYLPEYPAFLQHVLALVADVDAAVELDGEPVEGWTQMLNAPFKYTRVRLGAGDHEIASTAGRFSGVASGRMWGYEFYKPLRANDDEKDRGGQLMHPTVYHERLGVAYAYPLLPGFREHDSIGITTRDDCRSSTIDVDVVRGGSAVRVTIGDTVNSLPSLVPTMKAGRIVGWSARFTPIDAARDASATLYVYSPFGNSRTIPYGYVPTRVVPSVSELTLYNVVIDEPRAFEIALANRGALANTVRVRLASGAAGFAFTSGVPGTINAGDTARLGLSFVGSSYATKYYDTLIVDGDCLALRVPLSAWTRSHVPEPAPAMTGADWRNRWLSTLDECTKSNIERYDSTISITNHGTRAYVVTSIELVGADAASGIFTLDNSNPARSVVYGDIVYPDSLVVQDVRFRPRDERTYRCDVRLITSDGDTVTSELRGVGIESHVAVEPDPLDMGTSLFRGDGVVIATSEVLVRALPTRPLTVTGISIEGNDALHIDRSRGFVAPDPADASTWWHLDPGASRIVPIAYAPHDSGSASARLIVTGDHATCDDSSMTIHARAYRVLASIETPSLTGASGCGPTIGNATLRNTGPTPLMIAGAEIDPATAPFTLQLPALPMTLAPGASIDIPVVFAPAAAGVFTASLVVDVRDTSDALRIAVPPATLTGESAADTLRLRMSTVSGILPGERARLDVMLDAPIDRGRADRIDVDVRIDRRLFRVVEIEGGELTRDWTVTAIENSDSLVRVAMVAGAGTSLEGAGSILTLHLEAYMSDRIETDVPFTASIPSSGCIGLATTPGHVRLDSICGLNSRLIQALAASYALDDVSVRADRRAVVAFTLGADRHTTVELIDASGAVVLRLIDAPMRAGRHEYSWPLEGLPSGVYIVRVTSGSWSGARRLTVAR